MDAGKKTVEAVEKRRSHFAEWRKRAKSEVLKRELQKAEKATGEIISTLGWIAEQSKKRLTKHMEESAHDAESIKESADKIIEQITTVTEKLANADADEASRSLADLEGQTLAIATDMWKMRADRLAMEGWIYKIKLEWLDHLTDALTREVLAVDRKGFRLNVAVQAFQVAIGSTPAGPFVAVPQAVWDILTRASRNRSVADTEMRYLEDYRDAVERWTESSHVVVEDL